MKISERQAPKQERSRRRYEHILQTAAALFQTQGIEAVSTNHIAAEAGVSIGSLYQFFPNKEAIIEALIESFLAEIDAVFPQFIDTAIPLEALSREIIARFISLEDKHLGFKTVFLGQDEHRLHSRLIEGISRLLSAYYPSLSAEKSRLGATVILGITKGLMPLSLPQDLLLDEIHRAVVAYQEAFLRSEALS